MRRICELAGVAPAVLYNRIHFIHRRCEHFSRAHERPLIDGKTFEQLHIAVDRQDHVLNWGSQMDRRNTQMSAVASAENRTGYVFGMHLDYDPGIDVYEADLHAREIGDYELEGAYRHYARIWLPRDWYRESESRTDFTLPEGNGRLPAQGVRVYRDYTLFAHFLYLRRLLPGAEKILFFLDQEGGIRAACLTAFGDRMHRGGMEAFLVKINKSLTIDKKRLAVAARERGLERARTVAKNADLSNWQVAHTLMETSYRQQLKTVKKSQARWIAHPLPHMGEPEKAVCYLTERSAVGASDVAQMMVHASLHSIDRYFMQLRRRVSLLERPISTPSAVNRVWHGTSAYNPEIVAKLMDIFRVTYNYALAGRDKKTPAMRLGLAEAPYSLDALLNFNPL